MPRGLERQFGAHVLRNQQSQLRRSMRGLRREGFHRVFVLNGDEEIEAATFEREPLWNDRRTDHGPFDIIGDIHGCHAELVELLTRSATRSDPTARASSHPRAAGRSSSATWSTGDRPPRQCCAWSWAWWPTGLRSASRETTR